MSEASKSFQHQARKKGVHVGSRIICGPFYDPFHLEVLWSGLICGTVQFPVPQNNFEIHCFLKVILINMFPKIHAVSFPKFQTHRVIMRAGLTYCRT